MVKCKYIGANAKKGCATGSAADRTARARAERRSDLASQNLAREAAKRKKDVNFRGNEAKDVLQTKHLSFLRGQKQTGNEAEKGANEAKKEPNEAKNGANRAKFRP